MTYIWQSINILQWIFTNHLLFFDGPFARHRIGKHSDWISEFQIHTLVMSGNTFIHIETIQIKCKRPNINVITLICNLTYVWKLMLCTSYMCIVHACFSSALLCINIVSIIAEDGIITKTLAILKWNKVKLL